MIIADEIQLDDVKARFDRALDRLDNAALADWAREYGADLIELASEGFAWKDGDDDDEY